MRVCVCMCMHVLCVSKWDQGTGLVAGVLCLLLPTPW